MKNTLFAGLAAGALLLTSCGDKKADTGVEKDNLKPNEAVQNWTKDLSEGRVASLWDSLPSSYQSDVAGILHSVGDKMDAEVYKEAMTTVTAATELLKDKKSMIVAMVKEQAPKSEKENMDKLEASYDSIVGLLNAVATSDAKDVDGLKNLDVAKFLGDLQEHTKELSSLSSLAGEDMENLKAMTAKLVSESGDAAEVEITMDGRAEKVKFVKKDDRWIPEDMSKEWSEMIKEAKAGIGEMADLKPVQKEQVLAVLRMAQASIKELKKAETKEDMMNKVGEVMQQLGGM